MSIGLTGASGVGKTTLAKLAEERLNIPYVNIGAGHFFKSLGISQADQLPLHERIDIQRELLNHAEHHWAQPRAMFISDRTPLCIYAYTIAECQRTGWDEMSDYKMKLFGQECFRAVSRHFAGILFMPPALPYVARDTRPPPSTAFQEHTSLIIQGLVHDQRVNARTWSLAMQSTNLDARVNIIAQIRDLLIEIAHQERKQLGALIQ